MAKAKDKATPPLPKPSIRVGPGKHTKKHSWTHRLGYTGHDHYDALRISSKLQSSSQPTGNPFRTPSKASFKLWV